MINNKCIRFTAGGAGVPSDLGLGGVGVGPALSGSVNGVDETVFGDGFGLGGGAPVSFPGAGASLGGGVPLSKCMNVTLF